MSSNSPHQTSSPVRHRELAGELIDELASARYAVGARYPTEQELQRRFGVGRHTVREALKIMTEQGLLGRRRKTGTVVLAMRPPSTYVHTLRDFDGLFDFAHTTDLRVLHTGFVSHPRILPADLQEEGDGRWFRVAGIRYRKGQSEPLCWSEVMVAARFAPDRAAVEAGDRAIYEITLERHGIKLGHVEQDISAVPLPATLAASLEAGDVRAGLLVRRRYVTPTGETFEVSLNTYPADRYSVRSILRKRA
ncbi:GntR family transcriptional regulator [Enterovirga rhinocerotis]|uniref:DNA-binding GntR family transcriptional regulator n=1 Tax=Enterovirga rhinocerotis TaxID=1339210 RepID=A0A4R7BT42_9HYPH|nr:GntR family transcriptional regulator [Enterovirga rhinocerotis]TDR88072.1 DNA-binding GntR family transcriptional regulator [Enterovirga rhinocerotis]